MAERVSDLHSLLDSCAKCGKCRSVCPVFDILRDEKFVARGRMSLLQEKLKGRAVSDDRLKDIFYACLKCCRCQANCPSHVQVLEIVSQLGYLYAGRGFKERAMVALLRRVLPSRRLYDLGIGLARTGQRILPRRQITRTRHLPLALFGRQGLPQLASVSALQDPSTAQPRGEVLLFLGCLVNYVYPQIAGAAVKLLQEAGFSVALPPRQLCCGMPLKSLGDERGAQDMARRNLAVFEAAQPTWIVSPCPTCSSQLKDGYPKLLGQEAVSWADKVTDLTALLTDRGFKRVHAGAQSMVYHDSCHLTHLMQIKAQPRTLLKLRGELLEIPEGQQCCGLGGVFGLMRPALSTRIGEHRAQAILATGADRLVTGCPGCMVQLGERLEAIGKPLPVLHTLEALAEGLDADGHASE